MKPYAILPFILQALAWPVAHFIFRINGTFTVYGREHLEGVKGPVIFASNHANDLDPVIQRAIVPMLSKPFFWVARTRGHYLETQTFKGWQKFIYSTWFFRAWGAYPAYGGLKDYEKSLSHHIRILEDGYSIGVFPQGRRIRTALVEEARKFPARGGVAFLAHHTNTPIIPVAISGTAGIDYKKLFFRRTKIVIHILPPVTVTERDVHYTEAAQRIVDRIYSAMDV